MDTEGAKRGKGMDEPESSNDVHALSLPMTISPDWINITRLDLQEVQL